MVLFQSLVVLLLFLRSVRVGVHVVLGLTARCEKISGPRGVRGEVRGRVHVVGGGVDGEGGLSRYENM